MLLLQMFLFLLTVSTVPSDLPNTREGITEFLLLVASAPWWVFAFTLIFALGWQMYVAIKAAATVHAIGEEVKRQKQLSTQFAEDSNALRDIRERLEGLEGLLRRNLDDIASAMQTSMENAAALATYAKEIAAVEASIQTSNWHMQKFLGGENEWGPFSLSQGNTMKLISELNPKVNTVAPQDIPEYAFDMPADISSLPIDQREIVRIYLSESRIFQHTIQRARERSKISQNRTLRFSGHDKLFKERGS